MAALTAPIESVAANEARALENIKLALDAELVELLFIDLGSGHYLSTKSSSYIDLMYDKPTISELARTLRNCAKHGYHAVVGGTLYIPIIRDDTACIAFCICTGLDPNTKSGTFNSLVSQIVKQESARLLAAYSHRFLVGLIRGIKEPISVDVDADIYFQQLTEAVSDSMGLTTCCIRKLVDNDLICIGATGLGQAEYNHLDFLDQEFPKSFKRAIATEKVQVEPSAQSDAIVRSNNTLSKIQSYCVAPLVIMDQIWGVVSFATNTPYKFSALEIEGVESVANAAESAISNYEFEERNAAQLDALADVAMSMSGVDVAQAVRHEALGYQDTINNALASIKRTKDFAKLPETIKGDFETVEKYLVRQSASLNKIRLATRPPRRKVVQFSILKVFEEACDLLQAGRLDVENIYPRFVGKDVTIRGYKDWVHVALFNLILNSYDAFRSRKGAKSRNNEIVLEHKGVRNDRYVFHFRDNAGGIEVHKLKFPSKLGIKKIQSGELNSVLFEPNVSSKEEQGGSGYGLYLVRRGIQIHPESSVNVISIRGGVTFEIILKDS